MLLFFSLITVCLGCYNLSTSATSGILMDGGDGEYPADTECSWSLDPAGQTMVVNLLTIETEEGFDFLTVNGTVYEGGLDPISLTFNSSFEITFYSDASVQRFGFIISYHLSAESAPSACSVTGCSGHGTCSDGICVCDENYLGHTCHNGDRHDLMYLYEVCGRGEGWVASSGWGSADHVCTWTGIECYAGMRSSGINLASNNLVCTGIQDLPFAQYLEFLILTNNRLNGFVPEQLATTTFDLSLANTHISGTIPATLANYVSLETISLADNALSGTVPSELWRLTLLSDFNVERNSLFGRVPDQFEFLSEGTVLLDGNQLWCPSPTWSSVGSVSCNEVALDVVAPSSASQNSQEIISLRGGRFPLQSPMSCLFGQWLTSVTVISESECTCTSPLGVPGVYNLSIVQPQLDGRYIPVSFNALPFTMTIACPKGSYATDVHAQSCLVCPEGAICEESSNPKALAGWQASATNQFVFLPCFNPDACLEGGACAPGYKGPRCSECSNYGMNYNSRCTTCSDSLASFLLFILIAVPIIIGIVVYLAMHSVQGRAAWGLLLFYLQLLSTITTTRFNWHPAISSIGGVALLANLDPQRIGVVCSTKWPHWTQFVFFFFIPIFIGLIVVFVYFAHFLSHLVHHAQPGDYIKLRQRMLSAVLTTCEIAFIPVTTHALTAFRCESDVDRTYLASQPHIDCNTSGHKTAKISAWIGLIVYGVGIPALFVAIVFWHRRQLHKKNTQSSIGVLFLSLNYNVWWWKSLKLVWALSFLILTTALHHSPAMVALGGVLMIALLMLLHVWYPPFRFPRNNVVVHCITANALFALFCGLAFNHAETTTAANIIAAALIGVVAGTLILITHSIIYEYQFINHSKVERMLPSVTRFKLYDHTFPDPGIHTARFNTADETSSDEMITTHRRESGSASQPRIRPLSTYRSNADSIAEDDENQPVFPPSALSESLPVLRTTEPLGASARPLATSVESPLKPILSTSAESPLKPVEALSSET